MRIFTVGSHVSDVRLAIPSLSSLSIMEKLEQSHYYLKASLSFEQVPEFSLDATQLKAIILHALQSLHGQVGAAIPVDVLKCSRSSPTSMSALLRLPHSELVKVWSALTLLGSYNGCLCVFRVEQASASLLSLAVSSRTFQFHNHDSDIAKSLSIAEYM